MAKGKKTGGRRKGWRAPQTLAKEAAKIEKEVFREKVRQLVCAELEPMVRAQIEHAKGVSYMVLRMPDGSFARATDEKQIDVACKIGATAFKINTQAPNTQAFTALLDRALDKPQEQSQDINIKGSIDIPAILRQRFEKRRKSE